MAPSAFSLLSSYAPAPYAKTEELIGLAAEASKFGGIYATHMRNEGTGILPAIDEAVRIGRRSSHPRRNLAFQKWVANRVGGHMPEAIAKVNSARAEGSDISADTYAYNRLVQTIFPLSFPRGPTTAATPSSSKRLKDPAMRARIRKDMLTPSDQWDNEWQEIPGPEAVLIGVVNNPQLLPLQGKTLADIAQMWNKDPMDALFDLLIEDHALTLPWPSSACPSRTSPSPSNSHGFPLTTTRPALRPEGLLGQEQSSSPCLRHLSSHSAQVRSRRT